VLHSAREQSKDRLRSPGPSVGGSQRWSFIDKEGVVDAMVTGKFLNFHLKTPSCTSTLVMIAYDYPGKDLLVHGQ